MTVWCLFWVLYFAVACATVLCAAALGVSLLVICIDDILAKRF